MLNKCNMCGHEWKSKVEKPLACPRCKRYDWNNSKGEKPVTKTCGSSSKDKMKELTKIEIGKEFEEKTKGGGLNEKQRLK